MFTGGLLHVPLAPQDGTACSPFTSRFHSLGGANRFGTQTPPRALAFLRLEQS